MPDYYCMAVKENDISFVGARAQAPYEIRLRKKKRGKIASTNIHNKGNKHRKWPMRNNMWPLSAVQIGKR